MLGRRSQTHYPLIKLILEENKHTACLSSSLKIINTTGEETESPKLFRLWPKTCCQQTQLRPLKASIKSSYFGAFQGVLPSHGSRLCFSCVRGAEVWQYCHKSLSGSRGPNFSHSGLLKGRLMKLRLWNEVQMSHLSQRAKGLNCSPSRYTPKF